MQKRTSVDAARTGQDSAMTVGLSSHQLAEIQRRLKVKFRNTKLLEQAFIHRSYLNEYQRRHLKHNERLEFLGDAALEWVVTDRLYRAFPDKQEGLLTMYRSALVNTRTLMGVAQRLDIEEFILLSRGEARDTGRARHYILACVCEALIGAMSLDRGIGMVELFLDEWLFPQLY
ncbi:MAG: hypothetical protein HYT41_00440, partial [Candidatus Sungbacteria bacterium]|nr:hypothetical protein [Candidatus Sungbacteria bacterium]